MRSNTVQATTVVRPDYRASPINRPRASRADVQLRRQALLEIVASMRPMTVRQVFYQAIVRGIVEKTEANYDKVQTDLAILRRAGALPYSWIADTSRRARKPQTFEGVREALEDAARHYRKALWTDLNAYVEVWLEKEALAGVVVPVTATFDVPLMVTRGYPSLSFLHGAAEYIGELQVPVFLYHLGDFDPSGVDAGDKIEATLRQMAPRADISFERLALTPRQIADWNLPTRPTKTTDSRAKSFGPISAELDAIPPDILRSLVQEAIERHLPPDQMQMLMAEEAIERRLIAGLVGNLTRGAP